jgi:hypothetical protein
MWLGIVWYWGGRSNMGERHIASKRKNSFTKLSFWEGREIYWEFAILTSS